MEDVIVDDILMGGNVLWKNFSHGRMLHAGGNVFWEDMSYWRI